MQQLTINNLDALCMGAALLGSGGGGDTSILSGYVREQLNQYGAVNIMPVEDLTESDLVIPLAYIGSPDVSKTKGFDVKLFQSIINTVQRRFPEKNVILMPAEIGGCNALTPFVLAGAMQLPVLDADLIGRAFPKVSMCKPAITQANQLQDVYLSNYAGECVHFLVDNAAKIEEKARDYVKQFGGSASIAVYSFQGNDYQDYVIENSLSRALQLGEQLENDSFDSGSFCQKAQACSLANGTISDLTIQSGNGFLTGSVVLLSAQSHIKIAFQNEYFAVYRHQQLLAVSPDIIVLIDKENRLPVASESLQIGMHVELIKLPAPTYWLTKEAARQVDINQFIEVE